VRVLDRHRAVIDQDADRQCQAAQGHRVDGLAEAASTAIEVKIDSGIDTMTTSVERHEPRKIRIIRAVSPAPPLLPFLSTRHKGRQAIPLQ
jgi:hypothetical protein